MADRLLIIVLAASLLAGGLRPTAVGHSHIGGDRPHDHDRDSSGVAPAHHRHPHGHPHHGGAEQHRRDESRIDLSGGVPHWHVTIWFWDFTFPEIPSPGGGSEGSGMPVVVPIVDLPRVTPADSGPGWIVSGEYAEIVPVPPAVTGSACRAVAPHDSRILLCDTARRERSGVLLT